jgi:hypothetical protein
MIQLISFGCQGIATIHIGGCGLAKTMGWAKAAPLPSAQQNRA